MVNIDKVGSCQLRAHNIYWYAWRSRYYCKQTDVTNHQIDIKCVISRLQNESGGGFIEVHA